MTADVIISLSCAGVTLVATVVLGVIQCCQGRRMKKLALRQDEEEKAHRQQQIKAQRDAFLIKYNNSENDIYLLPLCWISSLYNSSMGYHREMYREYNMLEEEVQIAICKHMGFLLDKPVVEGKSFYSLCADALQKAEATYRFSKDTRAYFYDNAKYLERCVTRYGAMPISEGIFNVKMSLAERLESYHINTQFFSNPISSFMEAYGFSKLPEENACLLCAIAAEGIALDTECENGEVKYWIPGGYGKERIETMEDYFLCALFCVYVGLILQEEDKNE